MNVWVVLGSIFEPKNGAESGFIVSGDALMISVGVQGGTIQHCVKFSKNHDNQENFLVFNIVF